MTEMHQLLASLRDRFDEAMNTLESSRRTNEDIRHAASQMNMLLERFRGDSNELPAAQPPGGPSALPPSGMRRDAADRQGHGSRVANARSSSSGPRTPAADLRAALRMIAEMRLQHDATMEAINTSLAATAQARGEFAAQHIATMTAEAQARGELAAQIDALSAAAEATMAAEAQARGELAAQIDALGAAAEAMKASQAQERAADAKAERDRAAQRAAQADQAAEAKAEKDRGEALSRLVAGLLEGDAGLAGHPQVIRKRDRGKGCGDAACCRWLYVSASQRLE